MSKCIQSILHRQARNLMVLSVFDPLTLPNGTTLPNRIAKAAMEENMAVCGHLPGDDICNLYKTWSDGGAGLLITGNVMIDHRAMTGPGGISLETETDLEPFKKWAKSSTQNNNKIWNIKTNMTLWLNY